MVDSAKCGGIIKSRYLILNHSFSGVDIACPYLLIYSSCADLCDALYETNNTKVIASQMVTTKIIIYNYRYSSFCNIINIL